MENKGDIVSMSNLFGDVRAERDHDMLDASFHESQSYRILFESRARFVVVGRRGTGKSALTYRPSNDWADRKFSTIIIAPDEEHVIGIRPALSLPGDMRYYLRWRSSANRCCLSTRSTLCSKSMKLGFKCSGIWPN